MAGRIVGPLCLSLLPKEDIGSACLPLCSRSVWVSVHAHACSDGRKRKWHCRLCTALSRDLLHHCQLLQTQYQRGTAGHSTVVCFITNLTPVTELLVVTNQ